jgi:excisionase family DNA binding protein
MVTSADALSDAFLPEPDRLAAERSSASLARFVADQPEAGLKVRVEAEGKRETITIPPQAVRMLAGALAEMARGGAVTVVPTHAELTTQEAADLLQVSRPFVIEQMESGALPYRKVGTHRRVLLSDLLAYKRATDQQRKQALEELSALDQQLGLGY